MRCTCGAQLLPDSLFCHKCGKPQRDLGPVEPEPVVVAEIAPPPPLPPPGISFRNKLAVRTGLLCAGLAVLLIQLVPSPLLGMIWMFFWLTVAGFVAVYLYHRRSGQFLTVRSGAHLGWITGVFCALIFLVFIALAALDTNVIAKMTEQVRQQVAEQGKSGPDVEAALKFLESPGGITTMIVGSMLVLFVFVGGLPMLGGAICAKVLEKD